MSSATVELQEDFCLQALAVALQHPAVAADQKNICTLLQVCKAWRAAVQQSAASLTDVTFDTLITSHRFNAVSSFAGWLVKHAGLIRTVSIDSTQPPGCDNEVLLEVTQQLLEISLQATSAAAALGQGAPLRLHSYSSSVPPTAGLLAALPAATLTALNFSGTLVGSRWCLQLNKLTNLRQLHLDMDTMQTAAADNCLQEIGRLKQLTRLTLDAVPIVVDMQPLPAQLRRLDLKYQRLIWYYGVLVRTSVNLQHLTCLQQLSVVAGLLAVDSSIPSNLRTLSLNAEWGSGTLIGLDSLHQVTSVVLSKSCISRDHLKVLEQLPQLQDLSLHMSMLSAQRLVQTCASWHKVPLLDLTVNPDVLSVSELQQVMQHVAAATKLTRLVVDVGTISADDGDDDDPSGVAICEHLKALVNLKCLGLHIGRSWLFDTHDAHHLSALVGLTCLDLASKDSGPYLNAASVCLLAVTLTNLRAMTINWSQDRDPEHKCMSISVLPAIGRLAHLEALRVERLSISDAEQGLKFLTGLSSLTELEGEPSQNTKTCYRRLPQTTGSGSMKLLMMRWHSIPVCDHYLGGKPLDQMEYQTKFCRHYQIRARKQYTI